MFTVHCTNDKLWNFIELVHYLSTNQHQSIRLLINPEAIDIGRLGIYRLLDAFDFRQVCISTANPFETHDRYQIDNYWLDNRFIQQIWNVKQNLHSWNHRKIFLAFYHRPTAGRLAIAAYLLQNYAHHSKIHFSYGTTPDELIHFEIDKMLQFGVDSLDNVSDLLSRLPIWSATRPENLANIENMIVDEIQDSIHQDIYQDILIDVVVETHVTGKTFYPTEKTVRPMWMKKPFICFAAVNHLLYLRQMGFQTFGRYWDEDYDGYEGRDRFLRIKKVIDYIASRTESQLENMFVDMKPVLEHNYEILSQQSFSKNVHQVD